MRPEQTTGTELVERVAGAIEGALYADVKPNESRGERMAKAAIAEMQPDWDANAILAKEISEYCKVMAEMAEALAIQKDLSERREDFGEFYLQTHNVLAKYNKMMETS